MRSSCEIDNRACIGAMIVGKCTFKRDAESYFSLIRSLTVIVHRVSQSKRPPCGIAVVFQP